MNRKNKPKTDSILPQEDRYMSAAPRQVFSLLPGQSTGSRTKGKPISLPTIRHDPPMQRHKNKSKHIRPAGISIDRCDPSLVYETDPPASSNKLSSNMKTSDESKRKSQQKVQIQGTFGLNSTRSLPTQSSANSQTSADLRSTSRPTNINASDKGTFPRQIVNNNTEQDTVIQQHKPISTSRFDSRLNTESGRNFLLSKGINVDKKPQSRKKRNKGSDDDNNDKDEVYYSASSSLSATEETPRFILPIKTKRLKQHASKGTPISIPTLNSMEPSNISPSSMDHLPKKKKKPVMDMDMDPKFSPTPVELSDEEMCDANDTILFTYPLDRSKGSITITKEDRKRLEPGQFLNDSIIDFYLKWLMDSYTLRHHNDRTRLDTKRTHIFSSFFYNRLTQGMETGDQVKYENVRKWTTSIDLFDNKYAIFPINEKWHWYLVLVCNIDQCIPKDPLDATLKGPVAKNRPIMFVLDSLGGNQKASMTHLTNYLRKEAATRRNVNPADFVRPLLLPTNVPKQDNSCDCGVFLLHFVEKFLNSPQEFVDILLAEDSRHPKWKERDIKDKRRDLQILFKKVHRTYKAQYGSSNNLSS